MADLKRCWNCAKYSSCTDYRTFAYGCLYCGDYAKEKNIGVCIKNGLDFLKISEPQPTEESSILFGICGDNEEDF